MPPPPTHADLAHAIRRAGLPLLVMDERQWQRLRWFRGTVGVIGLLLILAMYGLGVYGGHGATTAYAIAALTLAYVIWAAGGVAVVRALGRHWLDGIGRAASVAVASLAPMLVLLLFLFYTSELWLVFGALPLWRHLALIALFVALVVSVIAANVRGEIRELMTVPDPDTLRARARDTIAAPLAARAAPAPPGDLSPAAARSIGAALVIIVLLRVVVVAVAVTLALIGVGLLTMDVALMESWAASATGVWPLVHVAATLGAFAGVSFAVVASTDRQARAQLVGDEVVRLGAGVALWAYWREAARASRD